VEGAEPLAPGRRGAGDSKASGGGRPARRGARSAPKKTVALTRSWRSTRSSTSGALRAPRTALRAAPTRMPL